MFLDLLPNTLSTPNCEYYLQDLFLDIVFMIGYLLTAFAMSTTLVLSLVR